MTEGSFNVKLVPIPSSELIEFYPYVNLMITCLVSGGIFSYLIYFWL